MRSMTISLAVPLFLLLLASCFCSDLKTLHQQSILISPISPIANGPGTIYTLCYNFTAGAVSTTRTSVQHVRPMDIAAALDTVTECGTSTTVGQLDWVELEYRINDGTAFSLFTVDGAATIVADPAVWGAVDSQAIVAKCYQDAEHRSRLHSVPTGIAETIPAETYEDEVNADAATLLLKRLPSHRLDALDTTAAGLHTSGVLGVAGEDAVFDLTAQLTTLQTAGTAYNTKAATLTDIADIHDETQAMVTAVASLVTTLASSMTTAGSWAAGAEETDPRPRDEAIWSASMVVQSALSDVAGIVTVVALQECEAGFKDSATCDSTLIDPMVAAIQAFLAAVRDGVAGLELFSDKQYGSALPCYKAWAEATLAIPAPTSFEWPALSPVLRGCLSSDLHGIGHKYFSDRILFAGPFTGFMMNPALAERSTVLDGFWTETAASIYQGGNMHTNFFPNPVPPYITPPKTVTGIPDDVTAMLDLFPVYQPVSGGDIDRLPTMSILPVVDKNCDDGCGSGYYCDSDKLTPVPIGYFSPAGQCTTSACTLGTGEVAVGAGRGSDACPTVCADETLYRSADGSCAAVPAGYVSSYGSDAIVYKATLNQTDYESHISDMISNGSLTPGVCTANCSQVGPFTHPAPTDVAVTYTSATDEYAVSYEQSDYAPFWLKNYCVDKALKFTNVKELPWTQPLTVPFTMKLERYGFDSQRRATKYVIPGLVNVMLREDIDTSTIEVRLKLLDATDTDVDGVEIAKEWTGVPLAQFTVRTMSLLIVTEDSITVISDNAADEPVILDGDVVKARIAARYQERLINCRLMPGPCEKVGFDYDATSTAPQHTIRIEMHEGFTPDLDLLKMESTTLPRGAAAGYIATDIEAAAITTPVINPTLCSIGQYARITTPKVRVRAEGFGAEYTIGLSQDNDTIAVTSTGTDLTVADTHVGSVTSIVTPSTPWDSITVTSTGPILVSIEAMDAAGLHPVLLFRGTVKDTTTRLDHRSIADYHPGLPAHAAVTCHSCGLPIQQQMSPGFGSDTCHMVDDSGDLIVGISRLECNLTADGVETNVTIAGQMFEYDPALGVPFITCNTDDFVLCNGDVTSCANATSSTVVIGPETITRDNHIKCVYANTTKTDNELSMCLTAAPTLPVPHADLVSSGAVPDVRAQFSVSVFDVLDVGTISVAVFPGRVGAIPLVPSAWTSVAASSGKGVAAGMLHPAMTVGLTSPIAKPSSVTTVTPSSAVTPITLASDALTDSIIIDPSAMVTPPRLQDPTTMTAVPLETPMDTSHARGGAIVVDIDDIIAYPGNVVSSATSGLGGLTGCSGEVEWQMALTSADVADNVWAAAAPARHGDACLLIVPVPDSVGTFSLRLRMRVAGHGYRVMAPIPTPSLDGTTTTWTASISHSGWTNRIEYTFTVRDRMTDIVPQVATSLTNTTLDVAFNRQGADSFIAYQGECQEVTKVDRYAASPTIIATADRPYLFNSTKFTVPREETTAPYCVHWIAADRAPSDGVQVLAPPVGFSEVVGVQFIVLGVVATIGLVCGLTLCCAAGLLSWIAQTKQEQPIALFAPTTSTCYVCGRQREVIRTLETVRHPPRHHIVDHLPEADRLALHAGPDRPVCTECFTMDVARVLHCIAPDGRIVGAEPTQLVAQIAGMVDEVSGMKNRVKSAFGFGSKSKLR